MPAPKLLAALPKPVLFGLYGAVGGLLGALVFGEPLYLALEPPRAAAARPEPAVAVAASPEVPVAVSGTNTFGVEVARAEFDGPVTVRFEGLPEGVSVAAVTVPKGETKATATVTARGAAVAVAPVKVVADATAGEKALTASAATRVVVLDPSRPQADIVFVLDVTQSMGWAINGLRDGMGGFAEHMRKEKVDFRAGAVAFRDLFAQEPLESLRFRGVKGGDPGFTDDAAEFSREVGKLTAVGGGDDPESTLDAVLAACDYPFRKGATKVLVVVTDNPPKNLFKQGAATDRNQTAPPDEVREVADRVRAAKIDFVHVVTLPQVGAYRPLQDAALGKSQTFDLGRVARGTGFNDLVSDFGRTVATAAAAKNPDGKLQVGGEAAKPELGQKSLQSNTEYAKGSNTRLAVLSALWTGAVAALVCLALVAGQHHYLRGTLPAAAGLATGLLGGLVAGLIGGATGQGVYAVAAGGKFLSVVFQLVGWAMLGGLAGVGLSLFIPNLKRVHGLAGGAIGGTAGAVGFIAVSSATGDVAGRLAGGLLLGFCIGLMVAVAEAAFRRAWLEVRYGERETITVNLGPEPVKIGGDAPACTVWARGAAPLALRYFVRNGQVICEDSPARTEAVVTEGDVREVGNVRLTVRTGAGISTPVPARPVPTGGLTSPARPEPARPKPAPAHEEDDLLPMPMPVAAPKPPAPVKAPPTRGLTTPARPEPPKAPVSAPKPAAARDPDACPSCGRKNPGRPGARYCMVCDNMY
jgi:hypothetical protein